jgi:uncharacterized membrane protein
MSIKGKNKNQDKIAAKKAAVLGTGKKSRWPLFAAIAGVILIFGATVFFVGQSSNNPTSTASAPISSNATLATFPAGLFEDGQARHFEHSDGNLTIRYFILKSSDGIIRAAFDACDVCWPAGKGYFQDGDYMVCRNCGRKFASILVNEVKGGCNPAPLNRTIQDGTVTIQIKDIMDGKKYFDFSGKV